MYRIKRTHFPVSLLPEPHRWLVRIPIHETWLLLYAILTTQNNDQSKSVCRSKSGDDDDDDGDRHHLKSRCWALYRLSPSPHWWVWLPGPSAGPSIRRTVQPSRDAMVASFIPRAIHLLSSPLLRCTQLFFGILRGRRAKRCDGDFLSRRLFYQRRNDPRCAYIIHTHPSFPS